MLNVFRPSFEVVRDGRNLDFVSGIRRFELSNKRLFPILEPPLTFPKNPKGKSDSLENSFKFPWNNQCWRILFKAGVNGWVLHTVWSPVY
jgi:hypothetical protein